MVYVVKKTIHGKDYYYLKESKRIGDKIISKKGFILQSRTYKILVRSEVIVFKIFY